MQKKFKIKFKNIGNTFNKLDEFYKNNKMIKEEGDKLILTLPEFTKETVEDVINKNSARETKIRILDSIESLNSLIPFYLKDFLFSFDFDINKRDEIITESIIAYLSGFPDSAELMSALGDEIVLNSMKRKLKNDKEATEKLNLFLEERKKILNLINKDFSVYIVLGTYISLLSLIYTEKMIENKVPLNNDGMMELDFLSIFANENELLDEFIEKNGERIFFDILKNIALIINGENIFSLETKTIENTNNIIWN